MSSETIVAKRYAKALFAVAKEKSMIERVEEELRAIVEAVGENPDFQNLLLHPNIEAKTKLGMMSAILEGKVSDPVWGMLKLLIERGRESILTSLYNDFIDIADEALGQANATVYTPFALNEKEEREIAEGFGRLTGKKIRIETVIDPSLLGGIKVRIGDRLYDGSLAGKLARLQKNLNEAQAM